MNKTKLYLLIASAAALTMSGCAAMHPAAGALYSDLKTPITASSSAAATKEGVSDKCTSILGLIATGDCSIENAKANGGIKDVSSVDYKSKNILGIIHTGQTVVKGK